jgi:hypothetical protein
VNIVCQTSLSENLMTFGICILTDKHLAMGACGRFFFSWIGGWVGSRPVGACIMINCGLSLHTLVNDFNKF